MLVVLCWQGDVGTGAARAGCRPPPAAAAADAAGVGRRRELGTVSPRLSILPQLGGFERDGRRNSRPRDLGLRGVRIGYL